jgi:hypothetical protein
MAILLIVVVITFALAARAGVWGRRWSAAGSAEDTALVDTGLVDTCARTLAIVLVSLIGLLALGVTYGNVLGAANP